MTEISREPGAETPENIEAITRKNAAREFLDVQEARNKTRQFSTEAERDAGADYVKDNVVQFPGSKTEPNAEVEHNANEPKFSDKTLQFVNRFGVATSTVEATKIMNEALAAVNSGAVPPHEALDLIDEGSKNIERLKGKDTTQAV